jgi:hypothetical protein
MSCWGVNSLNHLGEIQEGSRIRALFSRGSMWTLCGFVEKED